MIIRQTTRDSSKATLCFSLTSVTNRGRKVQSDMIHQIIWESSAGTLQRVRICGAAWRRR